MQRESKAVISEERKQEIKENTQLSAGGFRGIKDDTYKYFGVRHEVDAEGNVLAQYCPVTQEGELTGYKVREIPKNFRAEGRVGADCELFMQFRFQRGGKYLLLTESEIDGLSAWQLLKDYSVSRGSDYETAVVASTVGCNCNRQVANNYAFFDSFENIIIGFDNDKAGQKATEEVIKVLPKGKVKIMQLRYKDANEYLENDDSRGFIRDFYDAHPHVPVGVIGSGQISQSMRALFDIPKIPLPPFMSGLQDMLADGIPLGCIVNLVSASGAGKSTFVEECKYYWIFHCPHLLGTVTLESTKEQYGIKLLSRHIGKKIFALSNEVAKELLAQKDIIEKEKDLFYLPDGSHRFFLVDNRDGSVEDIKSAIENLIISCGCKVIVLDPIHDIIASLPREEQDNFVTWLKGMVKSHVVTFINVCHTRKTQGSQKAGSTGADLHEEDIMGSSALYKSASINLVFNRNKEAEDPIERNTTILKLTKSRDVGVTGIAGVYYYDNSTHTVHDKAVYFGGSI